MVTEERREVRWMKKEFTDKIDGVKSLVLLAIIHHWHVN